MTTFTDRPNTALLVIDVQNGVVDNAHDRDGVVGRIAGLVDKAREQDVPVVWVQHSSEELPLESEQWKYVPELERRDGEPLIHKTFGDSFEDTDLGDVLERLGVGNLVVTGAQTDACIRSTLHGALTRGYDATLVADAHTTEDLRQWGVPVSPEQVIAHTNVYWSWTSAPGRAGTVVPAAEVSFSAAG